MIYAYSLCGRKVRSDLELPWLAPAEDADEPDLRVEASAFADPVSTPRATALFVSAHEECDIVRVPGLLRLRVESSRFALDLAPGADAAEARPFLVGIGLALWALRQGLVPFHGTALEDGRRTVAILGASGAGKSTLAAALCRRGHRLVTDGVLIVDPASGRILPGAPVIPLWADTARALGLATETLARVRPALQKYAWPAPVAAPEPPPLGGVLLLRADRHALEPAFSSRLGAGPAMARLRDLRYAAPFDLHAGAQGRSFRANSRLAQAGVRELVRTDDLARLEALADRVLAWDDGTREAP